MEGREIYNYIGYMNDKEEGSDIILQEKDKKVLEYLDSIKKFMDNISKDTLDEYRKDPETYFEESKVYKKLEEEFYDKYDSKMNFEIADKFVKECILFKLSKFKQSDLDKYGNIKSLTRKDHTCFIPRILINAYIREALDQLNKMNKNN